MESRTYCRDYISKDKAENVTYDKSTEDIGKEVHASQQALAFNLAVKSQRKQQAQKIYKYGSCYRIFEGEQIGVSNS